MTHPNITNTNRLQLTQSGLAIASNSSSALTGATTITPRPSISTQQHKAVNPNYVSKKEWSFTPRQKIKFTEDQALAAVVEYGLVGCLNERSLSQTYSRPLQIAKRNLHEAAKKNGTQEPPEIAHMVPQAKLLKAVRKMLTEFEDLGLPQDRASFATKLMELFEKHALQSPTEHLAYLLNATTVDELQVAAEKWCSAMIHSKKKLNIGNTEINNRETIRTLIKNAVNAHSESPENLRRALLHIMLDNACMHLFDRLKGNIANLFAQKHRDDDIASLMFPVLRYIGPPITTAIRHADEESLQPVMNTWLAKMRGEFSTAVDGWVANRRVTNAEETRQQMRQAFDDLQREVLTPWVTSICDSEMSIPDKRKELENIVNWTSDSFEFDPASGPHPAVNRDMTKKMIAVYQKLEKFIDAPPGESYELFYEAVDALMQAQSDLLARFGVSNAREFTASAEAAPMYAHIVFGEQRPQGFPPYEAMEPATSSGNTSADASSISLSVYHSAGAITLSMGDEVGATNITAEEAIELVKAARTAMAVNHMHFVNDDGGGSGQASITCKGKAYELNYEHAQGKITGLEIEGPDKDGQMRVVVHYPSATDGNAGKKEPDAAKNKGKQKEVATPAHHSPPVSAPAASVAGTIPATAHHSAGPVSLELPVKMRQAEITGKMAKILVDEAIAAMAAEHSHFRYEGGGSGKADFKRDDIAYRVSYNYEEGKITEFVIVMRDKMRDKNKDVNVLWLA